MLHSNIILFSSCLREDSRWTDHYCLIQPVESLKKRHKWFHNIADFYAVHIKDCVVAS